MFYQTKKYDGCSLQGEATIDKKGKRKIFGTILDITNRKLQEIKNREIESSLEKAQRIASIGSWEVIGDDERSYWSDEFYRIHGLTPQSVQPSAKLRLSLTHPEDQAGMKAALATAIKTGNPYSIEKRIVKPDGEIRWVLSQGEATVDLLTGKRKVSGTLLDITDRKKAEAEQKIIKTRLKQTLLFSRIGTVELNTQTGMLQLHDEMYRLLEEENAPAILPLSDFISNYILPEYLPVIEQAILKGTTLASSAESNVFVEFKMRTAKGNILCIEAQGTFKSDGTAMGILQDITHRKKAEQESKEKSLQIERMLNGITDGFFTVDNDLNFILVNPVFARQAQFQPQQMIGKNMLELYPSMRGRSLETHYRKAIEKQQSFTMEHRNPQNPSQIFQIHLYPSPEGLLVYYKDISIAKQAEDALAASELKNRLIIQNSGEGILMSSIDGDIFSANPMACKLLQRTEMEICEGGRSLVVDATDPNLLSILKERAEKGFYRGELRMKRKDGSTFISEINSTVFVTPSGDLNTTLIFRDITERRRLEQENERLANVASRTSNLVLFTDVEGKISWVNEGFSIVTEYTREEVIGKKPGDFLQGSETNPATVKLMSNKLKARQGFKTEVLNYTKSGKPYWLDIEVIPIHDKAGKLVEYMAIESDITLLKNAVYEMQRSEQTLHAFMDHAPMVAFAKDLQGRYTFYNQTYRNLMVGKELKSGHTDYDLFDKDFADLCLVRDQFVIDNDQAIQFEHRVQNQVFLEYKFPLKDAYNKIFAVGGISLNITEKLEAQRLVAESEERLRNLINNLPNGIIFRYLTDEQGGIHSFPFITSGSKNVLGYEPHEIMQNPMLAFEQVDPEMIPAMMEVAKSSQQNLTTFEFEYSITTPQGELKWVHTRSNPKLLPTGYTEWEGITLDITERKLAEEKLRINEERWEFAIEGTNDGVWDVDLKANTILLTYRCKEMLGYAEEEIGTSIDAWTNLIHPDDLPLLIKARNTVIQKEVKSFSNEHRKLCKDGSWKWVQVRGMVAARDKAGNALRMIGTYTDISVRRQQQEELFKSKKYLESLLNSQSSYLIRTDIDGKYTFVNNKFYEKFNFGRGELIGTDSLQTILPLDHDKCRETVMQCFQFPGKVVPVTLRKPRNDGGFVWTEWEFVAIQNENGELTGIQAVGLDSTERIIAIEQLRESEDRFRTLVEDVNVGILLQGPKAEMLLNNEAALNLLGVSQDQLLGRSSFDSEWNVIREDGSDFKGADHPVPMAIATKTPVRGCIMGVYRPKQNDRVWLLVDAVPRLNSQGEIIDVICTFNNITELKKAEQSLRFSRFTIDHSSDGIFWIKPDGSFFDINPQAHLSLGYSYEEMRNLGVPDIDSAYSRDVWPMHWQNLREKGSITFSTRQLRKDGAEIDVEVNANFIQFEGQEFNCAFVRDITNRKYEEGKLQESEARFKLAARVARIGVYEWNVMTNETFFDERAREIFKMQNTLPENIFQEWFEGINKEDLIAVQDAMDRTIKNGVPHELVYEWRSNRGEILTIHVNAIAKTDARGQTISVMGVATDITLEQASEARLRESEQRFRAIADTAPVYIWIADEDKMHTYFSKAYLEFTGRMLPQELGYGWSEKIHSEDLVGVIERFEYYFDKREPYRHEYRLRGSDGSYRWVLSNGVPRFLADGTFIGYIGSGIDISHQKIIEQQLIRSNREKDLLIKEIHHRVKNNLQLVSSVIYIRMMKMEEGKTKEFLEDTRKKIKAIALIHESVLQTDYLNQIDLHSYVNKLIVDLKVANSLNHSNIKVISQIDSIMVNLDVAVNCSLIVNELFTNSIKHAFGPDQAGEIIITIKRVANQIELKMSDTGPGMPAGIMPGQTSFGMQLLDVFFKQLDAKVTIKNKNGTVYSILFNN